MISLKTAGLVSQFCLSLFMLLAAASAQIVDINRGTGHLGSKETFTSVVLGAHNHECLFIADKVYTAESYSAFYAREWCKDALAANKPDFSQKTVIGWTAGGDCHMRVDLELYRNDTGKLVTLMVNTHYGGCRAGGGRSGIIAIDKLPADYHVRIVENGIDEIHNPDAKGRVKSVHTWTADGKLVEEKDWEKLQSEARTVKPQMTLPAGTEQKILRRASSRRFVCREDAGGVYTDAEFQKVLAIPDCSEASLLGVDLKRETVLGVTAKGECHLRAETRVFRDDAAKTYNVHVNTIYGECRSYGDLREWLVLEKFHPGYKVQWTYIKTDEDGKEMPGSAQILPANEIFWDSGCVSGSRRRSQFDFRTREQFLAGIRQDASKEFCIDKHKDLVDFSKHSLLGIGMTTGYCARPRGLAYKAIRDDAAKTVTLQVSYIQAGEVCRHMGGFALWVTVPKIPDGYETKFEVQNKTSSDR